MRQASTAQRATSADQAQPSAFPVVVGGAPGAPTSATEYRALIVRRGEFGDQLTSAQDRRKDLAQELMTLDADGRVGVVERLKVLDARIIRLERELDQTGQLIAGADPDVVQAARGLETSTEVPGDFGDRVANEIVPLAGMFSVFFMLPLAVAFARVVWKRASAPPRAPSQDAITAQRFDQLQQSMDAMAIEIERISEGQRYVAKLFNERDKDRAALRA